MANKRSTKDLSLSSNERLYLKDNHNFLFKIKKAKNFKSKYLDFYTFHVGFKKKLDDLLVVVFKELEEFSFNKDLTLEAVFDCSVKFKGVTSTT